jgi:hypothetical protein
MREEKAGRPVVEIDAQFTDYSLDNLECHEAGFDALMTGYSFLRGVTELSMIDGM